MTPSEIIPAVIAAITPVAPAGSVVRDDFSEAKEQDQEDILGASGAGIVVAVAPITGGAVADVITRGAIAGKYGVNITVRANLANAPSGTTADTILDLCLAFIVALLGSPALAVSVTGNFLTLEPEDIGCLSYTINVNVQSDTP